MEIYQSILSETKSMEIFFFYWNMYVRKYNILYISVNHGP